METSRAQGKSAAAVKFGRLAIADVLLLAAALSGLPGSTFATMPAEGVVECPIDGTSFRYPTLVSWHRLRTRLDGKPEPLQPPPPPVCPTDGFVFHQGEFTAVEVESLRDWVASADYQQLDCHSSYFRLAKIYERLGREDRRIAYAYLRASWQVDARADLHRLYLGESLDHLLKHLERRRRQGGASDPEQAASDRFLAGEIERQLGRFESARARFLRLREEEFPGKRALELELRLIEERNVDPQYRPGRLGEVEGGQAVRRHYRVEPGPSCRRSSGRQASG